MAFMDFDKKGKMVEVRCKSCPTVLVTADWEPTPAYCEVVIGMREPDGMLSKHETAMCKLCRKRMLLDGPKPGELEAIYTQDVEQWIDSAIRAKHKPLLAYQLGERQALRMPLRVLDEPSRKEAGLI